VKLAELRTVKDAIIVEFQDKVKALSSSVYGSGIRELTHVIFKTVDKNFNEPNPCLYAKNVIEELGLPLDSTAVLLTAVDVVKNYEIRVIEHPLPVMVLITVGLNNLACIDGKIHRYSQLTSASTINTLVVVGSYLSDNALVDLVSVVSGAKAVAFADAGLSCNLHKRAFATVTDAVIIASYHTGELVPYGGPATIIGSLVGKVVYEAVLTRAMKELTLNEKFKHVFGLKLEDFKRLCLKVYQYAPIPNTTTSDILRIIDEELNELLSDPNVWSIGIAFRELEFRGASGTIPGLSKQEYTEDSPKIMVDEILGIALSMYINGWKGMFCYYWIERIKNQIKEIKNLPMFSDDLVCSLIGAILSKIYDRIGHNIEKGD